MFGLHLDRSVGSPIAWNHPPRCVPFASRRPLDNPLDGAKTHCSGGPERSSGVDLTEFRLCRNVPGRVSRGSERGRDPVDHEDGHEADDECDDYIGWVVHAAINPGDGDHHRGERACSQGDGTGSSAVSVDGQNHGEGEAQGGRPTGMAGGEAIGRAVVGDEPAVEGFDRRPFTVDEVADGPEDRALDVDRSEDQHGLGRSSPVPEREDGEGGDDDDEHRGVPEGGSEIGESVPERGAIRLEPLHEPNLLAVESAAVVGFYHK